MSVLLILVPVPKHRATPTSFSVGPNRPASGVNDSSVGTQQWFNPGNIKFAEDNLSATTSSHFDVLSNYLKGSNFGFNIPAGAAITGILFEIRMFDSSQWNASGGCSDSIVSMVKGGSVQGANRAGHALATNGPRWESYGGSTDLWGLTWTPSDVNDQNFGGVLQVHLQGASGSGQQAGCSVDAFRITIYYSN